MNDAIELHQIKKSFAVGGEIFSVINNISVRIMRGELTMIVGPSGCGKTTLISIISGILSATSGEIKVFDHNLYLMSDYEKVIFRRKNIGFIFQQYNLLPALTAAENASIPLVAAGVSFDEAINVARQTLENLDMKGQSDKYPQQLSGGQQQRVAVARSLVHQPKLIICDEPTAALDGKAGHGVMQILREIANDKNRTVVIVSHDNRIYHFADRILTMSDGQIISDNKSHYFLQEDVSCLIT